MGKFCRCNYLFKTMYLWIGPWIPCSLGAFCLGRGVSLGLTPLSCSVGKLSENLRGGATAGLTVPG